jgi:hypothetical protein
MSMIAHAGVIQVWSFSWALGCGNMSNLDQYHRTSLSGVLYRAMAVWSHTLECSCGVIAHSVELPSHARIFRNTLWHDSTPNCSCCIISHSGMLLQPFCPLLDVDEAWMSTHSGVFLCHYRKILSAPDPALAPFWLILQYLVRANHYQIVIKLHWYNIKHYVMSRKYWTNWLKVLVLCLVTDGVPSTMW